MHDHAHGSEYERLLSTEKTRGANTTERIRADAFSSVGPIPRCRPFVSLRERGAQVPDCLRLLDHLDVDVPVGIDLRQRPSPQCRRIPFCVARLCSAPRHELRQAPELDKHEAQRC